MSKRLFSIVFVLLMVFSMVACNSTTQQPGDLVKLRFAALRIIDALPLFVAQEQGYFTELGLEVEIIPVASAPERDQLIASGQADGMINEMTSVLLADRTENTVQVVRLARSATDVLPVFRILASAASGVTTPDGLQDVETGISEGTIIEYLFDRLLEAEGFDEMLFRTVNIPSIPERLQLLGAGELDAAVLPDPASTMAISQGAVSVLDDSSHPEYGYTTLSFRTSYINDNPDTMKSFLQAWENAVDDINANPNKWKQLLLDQQILPGPLAETYNVPPFVTAKVPAEFQFDDAQDWVLAKGLLDRTLKYEDVVNASFLPSE